jgi:hypothetical protein
LREATVLNATCVARVQSVGQFVIVAMAKVAVGRYRPMIASYRLVHADETLKSVVATELRCTVLA